STHPIAKTIVEYAKDKGVLSKNGEMFKSIVGKGVQATIDGEVYYAGNLKLFEEMNTSLGNVKTKVDAIQNQGKKVVINGTQKEIMGIIFFSDSIRKTTFKVLDVLIKYDVC